MRPLRLLGRLAALPAAERGALLRAWGLFFVVELALRAGLSARLARRLERVRPVAAAPLDVARVPRLVDVAGRAVPFRKTCLTRALVAGCVLARLGTPVQLRFGVRWQAGHLEGHAWLESAGQSVFGLPAADAYAPLRAVVR